MSDEERQRQMDFILQSQARSEVRIDHLERVAKLMVRAGLRARRGMREQDARISTLVDSQLHTEEIARLNNEAIGELSESTRLNSAALIEVREIARRNSATVGELAEATRQNSAAIGQLAEIVRGLAEGRNGNGHQ